MRAAVLRQGRVETRTIVDPVGTRVSSRPVMFAVGGNR
jgi:hypothetical protein